MRRPPHSAAFSLIEMIMVMAVIILLVGIVLLVYPTVQRNMAKAKASTDIRSLTGALEAYKTDNGGYPQDPTKTDSLDARDTAASQSTGVGSKYAISSLYLYECLSGDTNDNGVIDANETGKNYAPDFFKPARLFGPMVNGRLTSVQYIKDPFGNSYGYSTAGLLLEQEYQAQMATNSNAPRPVTNSKGTRGYNPTFDLWSTGGDTTGNSNRWVKNW
ncbi:type II secretion system protein [Chthoniobacter flavus]|nr:type II secretion system protein [Chthoniobacter flavus]